MILREKWRAWLRVQLDPNADKIDVLGFALAIMTGILLCFAVWLFFNEVVYVHKYLYYSAHTWHVLFKRPDIFLVLTPALNFPLLVLRARSKTAQAYRRWTLAAALVLVAAAVILLVGGKLFYAFVETLP